MELKSILGNTYTLEILKFLEKFFSPLIPFYPSEKGLKIRFFTFLHIYSSELSFWFVEEFVRTLNFALVRPFVRSFATRFLGIPSLLVSENLQLLRACKGGKNVPSAFLKKSRFAHFGQKLLKIGHLAGCVQQSLQGLELPEKPENRCF